MLDIRVKQRLTGAIILVAALVLLVPELLTGPSRSASSVQASANADGAQMRSYTIDLADSSAARSGAAPAVETPVPESPSPAAAQKSDAAGISHSANDGDAGSNGAPQVQSAPVAQSSEGATADTAPEKSLAAPAPAEGAKPLARASAEAIKPPPVARAEAVKPSSPTRAASAPAARVASAELRPASGWAWQVGSFASRENAERLTRELKGKGFAASVSESSAKGKRLWRVRVGPESDRAAAVALGAKLRATGHSGGAPVPYP
jgi:DedD protein